MLKAIKFSKSEIEALVKAKPRHLVIQPSPEGDLSLYFKAFDDSEFWKVTMNYGAVYTVERSATGEDETWSVTGYAIDLAEVALAMNGDDPRRERSKETFEKLVLKRLENSSEPVVSGTLVGDFLGAYDGKDPIAQKGRRWLTEMEEAKTISSVEVATGAKGKKPRGYFSESEEARATREAAEKVRAQEVAKLSAAAETLTEMLGGAVSVTKDGVSLDMTAALALIGLMVGEVSSPAVEPETVEA